MGPIMGWGLLCSLSHMSWRKGLLYSGLGMVGVSSQLSVGRMSSFGVGVVGVPVAWGLLCLSRKMSSYVGGRPAEVMRA